MAECTIKFEAPELLAVLERIAQALEAEPKTRACDGAPVAPVKPEKPGEAVDAPQAAEKPAQAEPAAAAVKEEDLRKKVVQLSAAGKKAEVRDIVTAYASSVSGIPEDKRAEVYTKLQALEAES